MLPGPHRLTSAQDFSAVMRQRHRAGSATVVANVQLRSRSEGPRWRCGFIVSKAVGNAVVRHRTTRRLRHIVAELMASRKVELPEDRAADIVIRALAKAPAANHAALTADVESCLRRALSKAERS